MPYIFENFETLPSTNDYAFSFFEKQGRGPLWVRARHQTAGRGQYGRQWVSCPGNLHASLLICLEITYADILKFPVLSVLALRETLEVRMGLRNAVFEIKPPNDLLLNGGKLAGILVESRQINTHYFAIVIGFGVNIVSTPKSVFRQSERPAVCLRDFGYLLSADGVFHHLVHSVDQVLEHL